MLTEYGSWKVVREIGTGSFGTVYELRREEFGDVYSAALKVISIPKTETEIQEVRSQGVTQEGLTEYYAGFVEEIVKEIKLMYKLQGHTNIVSYQDHKVVEHKDGIGWDIYIQMELLKSLTQYISDNDNRISEQEVIKLGIDICRALERCQKFNIIHRDIKPQNIFVSQAGDFKLGDFGIARVSEKTSSEMSLKGTPTYMAPEVVRQRSYGFSVDLYSLGIVMYRLLNDNRPPFFPPYPETVHYQDQQKAFSLRMSGDPLPLPSQCKSRLGEIVVKACSYRVEDRYSSPKLMREELEALLFTEEEIPDESANFFDMPMGSGTLTGMQIPVEKSDVTPIQIDHVQVEAEEDSPEISGEPDVEPVPEKEPEKAEDTPLSFDDSIDMADQYEKTQAVYRRKSGSRKVSEPETDQSEEKKTEKESEKKKSAEERKQQKNNKEKSGNRLLPVILVLVALIAAVVIFLVMKGGSKVSVPDVRGMSMEEAKAALEEASLTVTVGDAIYSYDYAEGTVAGEDYEFKDGQKVEKGAEIILHESLGSTVVVQDVIGQKSAEAEKLLENDGFIVKTNEDYSDDIEEGNIISQSIKANTEAEYGSEISLIISKGPQPFALEKYKKQKLEDAQAAMEALGLVVEVEKSYSDKISKGLVISTEPAAGEEVKKGDTVTVKVSKGKQQVEVPDVTGKAKDDAKKALKAAGFGVKGTSTYSSSVSSGKVISQSVAGGTKTDKGAVITITISKGPAPETTSSSDSSYSGSSSSSGSSSYSGSSSSSDDYSSSDGYDLDSSADSDDFSWDDDSDWDY